MVTMMMIMMMKGNGLKKYLFLILIFFPNAMVTVSVSHGMYSNDGIIIIAGLTSVVVEIVVDVYPLARLP